VELPSDVWNIILNNLTNNEGEKDHQFISLSFISQVSKHIHAINKKFKQQLGIQSIEVGSIEFQQYFALNGYLNCMIYANENNRTQWNVAVC
jgi:hypothetical protein